MPNYFHYTSGKGLYGILSTGTLQCTHIDFLNDPTENKYLDSVLEDLFDQYPDYKKLYNILYNSSVEDVVYTFNYYVASFSKKSDSLHMWNYYANGNGYNIEMDLVSIKEYNKEHFDAIVLKNIIYERQKQMNILIEFFNSYQIQFDEHLNNSRNSSIESDDSYFGDFQSIQFSFSDELMNYKFLFKHIAYRHEEEVRLVIFQDFITNNTNTKYKTSNSGVIIQYTTLLLDLKNCIKSITVHPAASDLHQIGAHMFLNSIIGNVDKSKVKKSKVPFRII